MTSLRRHLLIIYASSLIVDLRSSIIRIGYMMDQLEPPYRAGAITMALRQAQADGLLSGYNFR
jgi:hypothetical protein